MLLATALGAAVLTSGCAVTPEPIAASERLQQIAADRAVLFSQQEPVTTAITLEEAIARAIKYNLDYRVTAMEEGLQLAQLDLSRYDLLPRLAANAGFTARSNQDASFSRNTSTNFRSVEPSTSSDQLRVASDLGLTWNILDFGLSYYQAKQQADRVLIAEERRRRVVHLIAQQVRTAFWLAATAERLKGRIEPVLARANLGLNDARRVERDRLLPPLDVLQYQKGLLAVIGQLESLERDLAIAKTQLGTLMNLPPDQPFTIALPADFNYKVPALQAEMDQLERLALYQRPDLREEAYQKRISRLEVHKAVLRMLPGIGMTASINHDTNSFLVNDAWSQAGVRATWNLLNLISGPAAIEAAEAQTGLSETRRLAQSVAALTQIHVGYHQFRRAVRQFDRDQMAQGIERRIAKVIGEESAGQVGTPLEAIQAETAAIAAEVARDRSYAEVQTAIANLYASLGIDPLPEEVPSHDLPTLIAAVAKMNDDLQAGRLPPAPDLPPVPAAEPTAPAGAAEVPTASAPVPAAAEAAAVAGRQTGTIIHAPS